MLCYVFWSQVEYGIVYFISENGPLVLMLQTYSQIFIVKHIDRDLVELIWTTKNCEISSVSGLVTKPSDQ